MFGALIPRAGSHLTLSPATHLHPRGHLLLEPGMGDELIPSGHPKQLEGFPEMK